MSSSSSSHYHPSGAYEDLRLPPIRNPVSYSSSSRAQASSRYVPPMEPPAQTSSSVYPRISGVTLPPLHHPEGRPRSSMGHSSQHYGSPSSSTPRHASRSSYENGLSSVSSSHRPSSHRRSGSLSVNAEHTSSSSYPAFSSPPSHSVAHTLGYHSTQEPTSPTATKTFTCDICGTSFSRAYDCKRHRDIHTRQGGHVCHYCHKTLSRADALKRHMERGCTGMEEDFEDLERERKERSKRHSTGGDAPPNYYSSSTRQR